MDEGRKRIIAIMASILAARKLSQYDSVPGYPPRLTPLLMLCAGQRGSWKKLIGTGQQSECDYRFHPIYSGSKYGHHFLNTAIILLNTAIIFLRPVPPRRHGLFLR